MSFLVLETKRVIALTGLFHYFLQTKNSPALTSLTAYNIRKIGL